MSSATVVRVRDRVSRQDPRASGSVCIRPYQPAVGQAYRTKDAWRDSARAAPWSSSPAATSALGRDALGARGQ